MLIGVTLGAVYLGGPIFAGLVGFLVVIMCFEWARMIEGRELSPVFYALSLGGAAAAVSASAALYDIALIASLIAGIAAAIASSRAGARRARWAFLGAVYFIAPSVALLWLRMSVDNGMGLTLWLFFIVWSADTGAYFAGRFFKGPRLSPSLSPAKTWSGAIGGVMLGGVSGAIGGYLIFGADSGMNSVLIGASLGLTSILGDMVESAFKRIFGRKDMSGIIPGHGGALDRLDGMIFATAAMALVLFGQILFAAGT